jgi:hypothetical protein
VGGRRYYPRDACWRRQRQRRSFHVGTLQRHCKKISDPLKEISDQKGCKSLPSVGKFNCSVICSTMYCHFCRYNTSIGLFIPMCPVRDSPIATDSQTAW